MNLVATLVVGIALPVSLAAQAPTAPRPSGRGAGRAAHRAVSTPLIVRDVSGNPIDGATVIVSDIGERLTTDVNGSVIATLDPGAHRLRIERDGFITLERDVTIRPGRATEIDIVLNRAPVAPTPAPPPPAPRPAPPPAAPPPPPVSTARPVIVSIPDFLDRNFIGRDPLKESVLGCTAGGTTRLLQLREPLVPHVHGDLDEVVYVVAGEGNVKAGEQVTAIGAGSLTIIPRGVRHTLQPRGKNPLVLLSVLTGSSCASGAQSP